MKVNKYAKEFISNKFCKNNRDRNENVEILHKLKMNGPNCSCGVKGTFK